MDLNKKQVWAEFFAKYNQELASCFQALLEGVETEDMLNSPDFDEALRNSVTNGMQQWYTQPLSDAYDATPAQIIDSIEDLDECVEVFLLAASQCDEELPELLKTRIGSFGVDAIDRILSIAFSASWKTMDEKDAERPDDMLSAAAAIRLLGDWNAADTMELVLTRYLSEPQPDEMISEAFVAYCASLGETAAPALTDALLKASADGSKLDGPYEYAIVALADVAGEHHQDSVFLCLRDCFRKMERKVIAAICLGDYGDGRAISVLKGYLDQHTDKIDRQLFYEILSSIKRLGGDISDIHDPFGGMAGRPKLPRQ